MLSKIRSNITLYKWFLFFIEPLFWGPVIVLYMQDVGGMTLKEIYFMESVVVLGMVVLEVPSGALADLIGRKKTIFIGALMILVATIGFAFAYMSIHIWIANIVYMIGLALMSGADTALFYDSLRALKREGEFKRLEGRAVSNRLFATAFLALGVGYLYEIDPRLPMYLGIPGVLIATILTLFMKEVGTRQKYGFTKQVDLVKISVLFVSNHKMVKWIIGFFVLVSVSSKLWFFTYNPYFEFVNIEPRYFGLIFFGIGMVSWFFSRYAHSIERHIGEYVSVWFMVVLLAFPMILMGIFPIVAMAGLVLVQSVVRGYTRPFLMNFLNQHLDSENRATVLSIRSAVMGLISSLALWGFGLALGVFSLPVALILLGTVTGSIGAWFIYLYKKIYR